MVSAPQEKTVNALYRTLDLLRTAQDPKDGKLQLARYAYLLARLLLLYAICIPLPVLIDMKINCRD